MNFDIRHQKLWENKKNIWNIECKRQKRCNKQKTTLFKIKIIIWAKEINCFLLRLRKNLNKMKWDA